MPSRTCMVMTSSAVPSPPSWPSPRRPVRRTAPGYPRPGDQPGHRRTDRPGPGRRCGWAGARPAGRGHPGLGAAGAAARPRRRHLVAAGPRRRAPGCCCWPCCAARPRSSGPRSAVVVAFATAVEYTFSPLLEVYVYRLRQRAGVRAAGPRPGLPVRAGDRPVGLGAPALPARSSPAPSSLGGAYAGWGLLGSPRPDVAGRVLVPLPARLPASGAGPARSTSAPSSS